MLSAARTWKTTAPTLPLRARLAMTWFEFAAIAFVPVLGLIVLYALWRGLASMSRVGMPVPA
jgi:hypothetical protein